MGSRNLLIYWMAGWYGRLFAGRFGGLAGIHFLSGFLGYAVGICCGIVLQRTSNFLVFSFLPGVSILRNILI
mgnify:CR=1 FL=1